MKWLGTKHWGMLLLGSWLVLTGLLHFAQISIANIDSIKAGLALAAGGLILMDR